MILTVLSAAGLLSTSSFSSGASSFFSASSDLVSFSSSLGCSSSPFFDFGSSFFSSVVTSFLSGGCFFSSEASFSSSLPSILITRRKSSVSSDFFGFSSVSTSGFFSSGCSGCSVVDSVSSVFSSDSPFPSFNLIYTPPNPSCANPC